jgi:hypothetical protein
VDVDNDDGAAPPARWPGGLVLRLSHSSERDEE